VTIATTALTVRTISDAELARANSLETQVGTLSATVDAQAVEIARLKALVAPPPPPVVVPPPVAQRSGLYVDGSKLRTRFGAELRLRVIEVMLNGNLKAYGYARFLQDMKALGFNGVSPLFEGSFGSLDEVKAFCDAALVLNLVVGVNADHQYRFLPGGTQGWVVQSTVVGGVTRYPLVELLNSYPHVYLVCDVETYVEDAKDASLPTWVASEKAKFGRFLAAGLRCPIKAGTHGGGRDVRYPLAKGAEIVALYPNALFTFQEYWKAAPGASWYYQWGNKADGGSFSDGLAGSKEALAACAASGLCFVVGFDVRDNVGDTGEAELIDTATRLGLSWAHWAATGDNSNSENNLRDWDFKALTPPKAVEAMLTAKCLPARVAFPDPTL
jgi:hypothetical protein